MMFKACLPISHLFDVPSGSRDRLCRKADVLEFKTAHMPPDLPFKPTVFHWGLGTVQDVFIPEFDRLHLGDFLKQISASLFSFDLGPACRKNQHVLPLSPTLSIDQLETITARSLDHVRRYFDGRLAVENYNYYPTGLYEHICRPDVIAGYLDRFDLGLVLDLAHASVSAANLRIGFHDYLAEFPRERIVEIHISRPYFHMPPVAGIAAVDAHLPPRDDDFQFLESFLGQLPNSGTILVNIEQYDCLDSVARSYERLAGIIESANKDLNDTAEARNFEC
jgi:uncharacterized protein